MKDKEGTSRSLARISIALLVGSFVALPFLGSYAPCESTSVRDLARFAVAYAVIAASLAGIGLSLTRLPTRAAVAALALVVLAFSALNLAMGEAMWYERTKGGGLALETGWYAAYGFPLKSFYVHLGAGPSQPTADCGVLRPSVRISLDPEVGRISERRVDRPWSANPGTEKTVEAPNPNGVVSRTHVTAQGYNPVGVDRRSRCPPWSRVAPRSCRQAGRSADPSLWYSTHFGVANRESELWVKLRLLHRGEDT